MKWLFPNVFSRLFRPARRPVVRRGSSRGRFRPNFEQLEDRRLLSFQMLFEQAGFAPKLITDNDVASGDTDPQAGVITFVGTYGTFNLFGDAGLSKPITGSPGMAEMNLTFNVVANPGGTLSISLSDTDFVDPPLAANPLTLTSSLGGTTGGTASTTVQAFADPTNAPFGTGVAAPVQGPFVAPSFADAATVSFNRGPSGYSLTSKTTFTLTPGALITGSHRLQVHGSPTPQPAALGDFVWEDLNANGVQDAGEPGIANVTVKLLDAGGNVVGTTTTDSNGKYLFSDLMPGTYSVMFVAPAGYMVSPANQGADDARDSDANVINGMTGNYTLASGETNLTLDAGLFRKAALGDFVWEDLNANGIQDTSEPGIANVTVKLLDASGNVVDTTTTDSNGKYLFSDLTPGTYSVMFVAPAGYMVSPANQGADDAKDSDANPANGMTGTYTLVSGQTDLTVDAGMFRKAALGDFVWEDLNANGIQDTGEPGIANVTVKLLDASGNVVDTTTTDSNGKYLFSDLTPGTYSVMFVAPAGYMVSTPNQGADDAKDSDANPINGMTGTYTLVSGQTDLTVDAGLFRKAALGDFVWEDLNANGIQDTGEPGIANVTVKLLDAGGNVVDTTTTDSNGKYLFSDLMPGTYSVMFVAPAGYMVSSANQGADDARDSDANVINGMTGNFTLASGETNLTVDAGLFRKAALGDFVWMDKDADGIQDVGEPGVANVAVKLMDPAGNVLATTTTDSNGKYLFSNLTPGTYKVMFVLPTGFTFSPANQGGDDARDSDANVTNGMTGNYTLASGETNLTVDAGLVEQKNEGCPPDYWKKCKNYDEWKCYDRWDKFDCVFGVNATGCYTLLESLCLSGTSEKALMREATAALLNAASSTIDYLYTVNQVISMVRQAYATCDFDRIKDLFAAQNTMGCGCHNQPPTGDPATASLTGYVYVDKDNDGRKDSGEAGIANVFIKLYGTDVNGKQVYLTTTTNSQGYYKFDGLKAGTYKIVECQPRNYRDGKDTAGNGGGTALNDQIVDIVLSMGEDSAGYNFGERYGYC